MTIPPPSGFGNSQRRTAWTMQFSTAGVAHRRVLEDRRDDLARRRDGELHHDAAAEVRLLRQLLLVAVLHLVDVAPDDAADDLLVERPANVRLTGDDVGRLGATATEAAGAAAVARAVAAAAALADGAEVAEADGALAGATAARAGADQAQTADAVRLADLVADQAAEDVGRVVAERRVATEDRGDVRALGLLEDAEDAGVLGLLLGELLGQVRIRVVLRTLQAVETLLVLGGLLAHLAFFALVALALAALLLGSFFFSHSGISSSFSSGGLMRNFTKRLSELKRSSDSDFGSGGTEKIMSRNSDERDRRADGVGLLAPAPDEERDLDDARAVGRRHQERRLAAIEARLAPGRQREAGAPLLDELLQRVDSGRPPGPHRPFAASR